MLIPKYWAQHKQSFKSSVSTGGASDSGESTQVTIKRYGWSDDSRAGALGRAKERVHEAHQRWLDGEDIVKRERSEEYNEKNGIPIREEIVAEYGFSERGLIAGHIADRQPEHQLSDTGLIVTRNGYGAQVANVNKIAIVDVDHADLLHHHYPDEYDENGYMTELAIKQSSPTGKVKVWFFVLAFVLIASVIAWLELSWLWLIAVMVAVTAYLWQQASKKDKARTQKRADDTASLQPLVVDLVRKRVATHSHEQFRLYETPEGFRLIATHDNIEPSDALVAEWFEHFHADANYVRLCQAQCCFRARLTAKPWRMAEVNEKGTLNKNIPTKDFWSMPSDDVDSEENEWRHAALEAREKWLADYDKYAKNYRACRYIETYSGREATRFGVAASDISTQALTRAAINGFIRWHDDACQVDKDLDLA